MVPPPSTISQEKSTTGLPTSGGAIFQLRFPLQNKPNVCRADIKGACTPFGPASWVVTRVQYTTSIKQCPPQSTCQATVSLLCFHASPVLAAFTNFKYGNVHIDINIFSFASWFLFQKCVLELYTLQHFSCTLFVHYHLVWCSGCFHLWCYLVWCPWLRPPLVLPGVVSVAVSTFGVAWRGVRGCFHPPSFLGLGEDYI